MDFVEFPKIARLNRDIIITEKIDGSNATLYIGEDGEFLTGSHHQWITPEKDNFGFARWAQQHKDELMVLGPGWFRGEWWGCGIQRGYDMSERRFSLFKPVPTLPLCCYNVPILYAGMFSQSEIDLALNTLRTQGSQATPHKYYNPEGIVIYHQAARMMFKVTLKGDEKPKGAKDDKII